VYRGLTTDSATHEEVLSVLIQNHAANDTFSSHSVAYIDLEASGLGDKSWPIEVGWAKNGEIPQSLLIKPFSDWPRAAWDSSAQSLHGLSIDDLNDHGLDVVHVCKKLNNFLAGATVYSDAPDWDGYWLYRLHTAARMRQTFKLAHIAELMPPINLAEKLQLVAKTNALAPHTHRAADDVRHMQVLHALAVLHQQNEAV